VQVSKRYKRSLKVVQAELKMVWKSDAGTYRYGFNGQEHEDEFTGGDYDFGVRMYDPRIARFLSLDPLKRLFTSESNYSYAGNSPIVLVDNKGEKKTWYITIIDKWGNETVIKVVDKNKVKTKQYELVYTESEGVGFKIPYTKEFDLKQTITIDHRKPAGQQVTFGEEEVETKNFFSEIWSKHDNIIMYGSGKYKGDIEMGENKRGSGKTVVVEVDEMLEILNTVKVLEGFEKEASKYVMEDVKKVLEKLDELKDAILELKPEEKIPEPTTTSKTTPTITPTGTKQTKTASDSIPCAACGGKNIHINDKQTHDVNGDGKTGN